MPSSKDLVYSLHPLEKKVLISAGTGSMADVMAGSGLGEAEVLTGAQMLQQRGLARVNHSGELCFSLSELGKKYLKDGLPEYRLLDELGSGEKKLAEIKSVSKEEISPALGQLRKNNLINVRKDGNDLLISATSAGKSVSSKNPLAFLTAEVPASKLTQEQKNLVAQFKARGLARENLKKSYSLELTKDGIAAKSELKKKDVELIDELTEDVLKNKSWKNKAFRHYDVGISVPVNEVGRRHPVMESNNVIRDVFLEMGFREMSGPIVESAMWNMDVMWIPQDHPARDEQDTFYLDGHSKLDKKLVEKERAMHENGIKRTHTHKGDWSEEVASRRLLRTHSTATSFRTLYRLSEEAKKNGKEIENGKYFYVAHNFRNEKVDATHLSEFFQAEGFIIGDGLSLADLMGFVKEYYSKLGIDKIMFKPTYNPYTEPSMEAHYYDKKLDKWYALINSGIFRPETLEPFGIHKTILAWGMGASRMATLLTGKTSMREITGPTCDFGWLKTRPNLTRSITKR